MQSSDDKRRQQKPAAATLTDQELFLSLVEAHQRMLLKVCWAYTRSSDDRDDLFQEILGRLWSAFGSFDRTRTFSTWMYRVALNVAIDCRRRRQRRDVSIQSLDEARDSPRPRDERKQDQLEELHELLEQYDDADRAILLLCLEGYSYREIGEVMGISESNVGTRLSRLKKSLRESVQGVEGVN
jgi:RNA polymerase sigma-70 factor (ECF subfamily)